VRKLPKEAKARLAETLVREAFRLGAGHA
jgi:hypothetical protein